jgi:nicotinate-nucleotide pyrophosphorylase (carboxylating)
VLTPLAPADYQDLVRRALEEDLGSGDITTNATVSLSQRARGVFVVKSPCVLAGMPIALEAFRQLEPSVQAAAHRLEGERCAPGDKVGEVVGSARTLLSAERTALNFLQRLSGVATMAQRFVDAARGRTIVLDTRKTTPTLRRIEKYAVLAGGARNHRRGLFDAILIKDNHVRLAGGVKEAIARVRASHPDLPLEVEAQSLPEVDEALDAGADVVLADNLSLDEIRETVKRAQNRAKVEISGGVTLDRVEELASSGADYVSVGALTHSAPAADISFEIEAIAF